MSLGHILAELSRLYPQGYRSFTMGGRRSIKAIPYPCAFGFRVNIEGAWHLFDRHGDYVSEGYENRVVAHKSRPRVVAAVENSL